MTDKKRLHLSEDLTLPVDAITQTFGVLAVRGAGKSNLAAVMAEEMSAAGLPFVVVDPVGSWYGLRSSADGKGPGLSIPVFGGRHGDIPLEKTGGTMIADVVVQDRLTCVLDLSEFSEGDKTRFLIDFAERLYRKNTEPLHLFLEEADDYVPQRPFREQARLLRAWENVVRRGRARGLGMTMITQRSAALNKNVLTQIETLFVLRTTSPQDRKAIAAWVEYHGAAHELLESLPELGPGEAWVWSPSWLKTMKRVQIRRRSTFDSGATPKDVKGGRPPATLADVDLARLRAQMADTIEKARADDPKALRLKVSQLEREVRELKMNPPEVKVERVEVPVLKDEQVKRLEAVSEKMIAEAERHGKAMAMFWETQDEINVAMLAALRSVAGLPPRALAPVATIGSRKPPIATAERPANTGPAGPRFNKRPATSSPGNGKDLSDRQQRIVDTIAMLGERGIEPTRVSVARWMGIHPNGGSFLQDIARLREAGILQPSGMELTEPAGFSHARGQETGRAAAIAAAGQKEPRQATILTAILDAGKPLSRQELADILGIHPNGGSFLQALARLREMGVIPEKGEIKGTDGVFA